MRPAVRSRVILAAAVLAGLVATAAPVSVRLAVEATAPVDLFVPASREVVDRGGRLLRPYPVEDGLWRLPTGVEDVDPLYLAMLLAAEDRRFREHAGVDPRAVLRAGWQLAANGRIVSGASTLTMQVVRLAERRRTRSPGGKLSQMAGALALERVADKDRILEAYLTLAPFGGNLEGVRTASLAWFGKEPRRLTAAEAALLVALPQSPEARRPDRHREAAKAARDRVLRRVAEAGVITAAEAERAMAEPVPARRRDVPILAPHLADAVAAADPAAAVRRLAVDGAPPARLAALARDRADALGAEVSVAILVADIATGEVLASVGSPGLFDLRRNGAVDMTRAVRSPGSTLKPFIYGLAFEEGIAHPSTLVEDRPTDFAGYDPRNFDKTFHGTVTVRRALELSLNVPAVQVLEAVGPARLIARLRRAGVRPSLPGSSAGLAVGLGGVGVTLRDLVTLYLALARGGEPLPLADLAGAVRVAPPEKPVLDQIAAAQVTGILAGRPGATVGEARLAVKTGTSYGYRDAWAIGYDGAHVIGVWVGRPDGEPLPGLMGADAAVPILADAFVRAGGVVRLPPPPPGLLDATTSELPGPLRRLRTPRSAVAARVPSPTIVYPPDGAEVELGLGLPDPQPLLLEVRDGRAPFTWFADGAPVGREPWRRDFVLAPGGAGFVTISVVDADGRADRVTVLLR